MGHDNTSRRSGTAGVTRRVAIGGLAAGAGATAGVLWGVRPPSIHSFQRSPGRPAPRCDDTLSLNTMFARGGDVVIPAGDYNVSVDDTGACLVVDVPDTRVRFERDATIRLRPTPLGGYVVLTLQAADCTITGGIVVGDLRHHAGSEGEWGHGVAVSAGADRCVLVGVQATECWGDGFYVNGGVADVQLVGCTSDGNRRQGLSVVYAVRPRIRGGSYGATGRYLSTAPASGIDLEPNPGGAVIDAVIEGVTMSGNEGQGLLVSARHGPVSATISGCTASHNGDAGFLFDGPGTQLVLRDSTSAANGRGLALSGPSRGVVATDVVANGCSGPGFVLDGIGNRLTACVASGNGGSGFVVRATAVGTVLESCSGSSNSVRKVVPDFDVAGPDTRLVSARSTAGIGSPSSAVVVRASALGSSVRGGSWAGPYAVATTQDLRTVGG